jgi:hypothetical protein
MLQARRNHMGTAPPPTASICRRPRLVGAVVTAVALASVPLLACAGIASAASKQPAPPPATTSVTSPTALDQDRSGQLPVVNINEAPGDFLGEGHDQIASALDGALKIYEAEKYGGGTPRSTPTDLRATPNGGFSYCTQPGACFAISPWQDATYEGVGASWSLTSVKVAASASNIYLAGATWDDNAPDGRSNGYQLHLYKLPHDGSCATAGCADKAVALPSRWESRPERYIVATSLAVGVVGGRTLIAVGFTDDGLRIYDENLNEVAHITDMAVDPGEPGVGDQTPPIRLAFGPPSGAGQGGFLTAGVVSPWLTCYAWQLNSDGSEAHRTRLCGDGVDKNIIASTAVMEVNGAPKAVFGVSNGAVYLVDFNGTAPFAAYGAGTAVTGLTGVTSWDDDPGNQHLVVGLLGGNGQVLKYPGGSGLQPIAIGAGGAKSGTWEQVRDWFPGYGAGRLQVANDTGGEVLVSMASSIDPDKGCWLNASVAGGPSAFPTTEATSVAAGQASPAFFMGALTAGADSPQVNGACAAAQAQQLGERAAYVVITPAGDQADQRLVKLRVDQFGVVRIDSQVGGDLNVALERAGGGGSWGGWRLRVTGPDEPAAQAPAPVVQGQRLTSAPGPGYQPPKVPVADDPARPVYRFDVSGARWDGLGAKGQVTARIPAMTAEGTVDGQDWKPLGQLMPVTAPTLSSDGTSVALGEASFFWQDAPGATPLTAVRVVSGGQASAPVRLAGLPAPPLDSSLPVALASLKVSPTDLSGSAMPRANGVDQAPLAVALSSNGAGVIANNDARYGLVYYRDAGTLSLITGLYTSGEYSDYVSVGPCRGAYPNDTLGRGLARKRRVRRGAGGGPLGCPGSSAQRNYLVTTSAGAQSLVAVINDSGTVAGDSTGPTESGDITVAARNNRLNAGGLATGTGIQVTGCGPTQGICTLVDPTAGPALYQAGNGTAGPATGLQLAAWAVTSTESLPLVVGGGVSHTLGSAPLNVTPTQAKLHSTPPFLSTDQVDTALVSSGELVFPTVPVGGAGAGRGRRPR